LPVWSEEVEQKKGQHKVDLLETLAASGSSHFFMIENSTVFLVQY